MTRVLFMILLSAAPLLAAEGPLSLPAEVASAEALRVGVVERVSRSTIAIFESSGGNGGSGVIVSPEGYAVTNFHVVQPCGPGMTCGLSDGRIREAVLVGLDPTGDIALIKFLGEGPFPAAEIGDSDTVRPGDRAIVVGNPFLLAEDFTPTVTCGVVSGVHRYQYPSGTLLEYADCLQTDAAINPGNSGGPLFDGRGRLIGINGRGSFEKRGRVNVGVGYAVSVNQVKRFLGSLRAGLVVDHAALGATVITRPGPRAIVDAIETDSDAYRRGLRPGDELVSLGGRDVTSANGLLNAVGVSPAGWRTRLEYRRGDTLHRADVRLGPLHAPGELIEAVRLDPPGGDPPAGVPGQWRSQFQSREGFANQHFNHLETERLLGLLSTPGALANGPLIDDESDDRVRIETTESGGLWESRRGRFRFDAGRDPVGQLAPPGAPGLLAGLWAWRVLATGDLESLDEAHASGQLPWTADGEPHDMLTARHRGMTVELFFEPGEGRLVGLEVTLDEGDDPTRIELADPVNERMTVRVGERLYADLRPAIDAAAPAPTDNEEPTP